MSMLTKFWLAVVAAIKVFVLARRTDEEIKNSARPTDVLPIAEVIPQFVVHPDHRHDWKGHVDPEVWERLQAFAEPIVLCDTEEAIQRGLYALSRDEIPAFREGAPLLRMMSAVKVRVPLGIGGRVKDLIEVDLRSALGFEVYRREIELAAIYALKERREGLNVDPTATSGLDILVDLAWVDGIRPSDRRAKKGSPPTVDEKLDFFTKLRDEGRRLATARVPGAGSPHEVRNQIIERVFAKNTGKSENLDAAMAIAAGHVALFARAWGHASAVAETKTGWAKRAFAHMNRQDGRRKRPFDPFAAETMKKAEHSKIVQHAFTPLELVEIGYCADIDPNLLCPAHALAWPEYAVARKLGRLKRGQEVAFEGVDAAVLRHAIFDEGEDRQMSMYSALRDLLREYALDCVALNVWQFQFDRATA